MHSSPAGRQYAVGLAVLTLLAMASLAIGSRRAGGAGGVGVG
ncbi:hypothetical protein ACFSS8_13230 [Paracoccus kondratievae]